MDQHQEQRKSTEQALQAERFGEWFMTRSGVQFYPLDPKPEEIRIEDIAHALAMLCRFGGHTSVFYSVAQHSVLVSEVVEQLVSDVPDLTTRERVDAVRWGLMHDAPEGLGLGDVIGPVKHAAEMYAYRSYERNLELAVAAAFGLPEEMPPVVKRADNILLATERRDLCRKPPTHKDREAPLLQKILPWSPELAKARFLERYDALIGRVQ